MRPAWRLWRVTTTLQHMHPASWQLPHTPVRSQGVPVCNIPTYGTAAVAGHAMV